MVGVINLRGVINFINLRMLGKEVDNLQRVLYVTFDTQG